MQWLARRAPPLLALCWLQCCVLVFPLWKAKSVRAVVRLAHGQWSYLTPALAELNAHYFLYNVNEPVSSIGYSVALGNTVGAYGQQGYGYVARDARRLAIRQADSLEFSPDVASTFVRTATTDEYVVFASSDEAMVFRWAGAQQDWVEDATLVLPSLVSAGEPAVLPDIGRLTALLAGRGCVRRSVSYEWHQRSDDVKGHLFWHGSGRPV